MTGVVDFQIIQREEDGYAEVVFSGQMPPDCKIESEVYAHVVREDDNLTVIDWTRCLIRDDQWSAGLRLPEGGLYRLEASLSDAESPMEWKRRLKNVCHVGVGDLYLLTGQSNMAGYGRDTAYDPPCLGVHLYGNNGRWQIATHPLNDSTESIYPENAEYPSGTSLALSFARLLKERIGLPVGLVQASLGGSSLAMWHPEENGILYRSMLRRMAVVGTVRGVLWHQGCSDANEKDSMTYLKRFTRMVKLWRKKLGNIPFLTVQLNRWTGGGHSAENDRYWGKIREAQRLAAQMIPQVYVVPSIDLSVTDGIHNSSSANVTIGERLAYTALSAIYKKPGQMAPSVSAVNYVDDTHVFVRFPPEFHVSAMDGSGIGMHIEDKNGLIECSAAEARDGGLLVTAVRPFTLPAEYHALWGCYPPAFVPRDRHGMPMLACYGVEVQKPGSM